MAHEETQGSEKRKDFFISYTSADRAWAEWVAWQLEQAGYSTIIQAWDFLAGSNFVHEMDKATREAERTIAVLSPDYFQSRFTPSEWHEAFRRDPTSEEGKLLPIRVKVCEVDGLLGAIGYIDLVGLDEVAARAKLLEKVRHERAKPSTAPAFPKASSAASPAFPGGEQPSIWTVPYQRNVLFTGREAELQAIAEALKAGQNVAINGLGGIGKTQTALEYAHRHRTEYGYIFWAIADSRDILNAAYSRFAKLLDLPGKNLAEQGLVIEAVKSWLAGQDGWLLILDNADDLAIIPDYLPSSISGHVLLTTRAHSMGRLAHRVEIKKLDQDEGSHFLLRRAALLGNDDPLGQATSGDLVLAREIVAELAGLPLALDQAGAYIEETSCGLQAYLDLYRTRHADLLRTRGGLLNDHPEPVATTWQLSFERVEQANRAAADLLRLSAFLAPADIPETIITEGASELTKPLKQLARDPLKLNAAIAELQKYSLIGRTPAKQTLDVHPLVQLALRDAMTVGVERAWAERTVRVVKQVFPWPDVETWEACRSLLAHGQACAVLIEEWQIELIEGARLLHHVGEYLYQHAEYQEAQLYYEKALAIKCKVLGEEDLDTLASMNNLAVVYHKQGKYDEAVALHERSLVIKRKVFGEQHPETATSLNNLATVYRDKDEYDKALALHEQALTIHREVLGEQHPDTAGSMVNLAIVYQKQEKYKEAETLLNQALQIERKLLGEEHPSTASSLDQLATVYIEQGKYDEAAALIEQALAIRRRTLGEQHPDTAKSLDNLAFAYDEQGKFADAEPLYQQALAIYRKVLGENHTDIARCMCNLGLLYQEQKRYKEALPLFERAVAIRLEKFGPEHPLTKETQSVYEETLRLVKRKRRRGSRE